jgi:hypothetical protein
MFIASKTLFYWISISIIYVYCFKDFSLLDFKFSFLLFQGPYAIILAPTRELAQQIEEECMKFGKELHFSLHRSVRNQKMKFLHFNFS